MKKHLCIGCNLRCLVWTHRKWLQETMCDTRACDNGFLFHLERWKQK